MKQGLAIVLLLAALPSFAEKPLTVAELDQRLTAIRGKSDRAVASHLAGLQVGERITPGRLSRWQVGFPGVKARLALLLLADSSQFLDLPASDIPPLPVPPIEDQRKWISLTLEYVGKTISQLPNFFATREVTYFEDTPPAIVAYQREHLAQPLHFVGRSSAIVLYRDGYEQLKDAPEKDTKPGLLGRRLVTSGEFGHIFKVVFMDVAHGKVVWSHWENSPDGPIAVFRFTVPKDSSHYSVPHCCSGESHATDDFPGYSGQLSIRPADGTIVRITLQADLDLTNPVVRADIMVDYAPVDIGGKTYMCPVKSVSYSQGLTADSPHFTTADSHKTIRDLPERFISSWYKSAINDVIFDQYHRFRSETQMFTGDESPGGGSQPDPRPDSTPQGTKPPSSESPPSQAGPS